MTLFVQATELLFLGKNDATYLGVNFPINF